MRISRVGSIIWTNGRQTKVLHLVTKQSDDPTYKLQITQRNQVCHQKSYCIHAIIPIPSNQIDGIFIECAVRYT